jgi:hypothetical protein
VVVNKLLEEAELNSAAKRQASGAGATRGAPTWLPPQDLHPEIFSLRYLGMGWSISASWTVERLETLETIRTVKLGVVCHEQWQTIFGQGILAILLVQLVNLLPFFQPEGFASLFSPYYPINLIKPNQGTYCQTTRSQAI